MKIKKYILSAVCSLAFCYVHAESHAFEVSKNLDIFNSLFRDLDTYYVDSINAEKLIQTAINKMLYTVDPYTNLITKEESKDFKYMTTGEYGGIGAIISQRKDNRVMITEPYKGKPADVAGLRAGDIFLEVDGESVEGKSVSDISNLLRGQPNTSVKLKIERPGAKKTLIVNVVREQIVVNPVVFADIVNGVGYIQLSSFTDKATDEIKKALLRMKNSGKEMKGLVLDLRSNPGGLITEAVNICNLFIAKNKTVVYTKGKDSQWDQTYKTTHEPIDENIRLVVMVDGSSASASEIVSGALQDMDRAVIIGENTYGKGLVQSTRPIGFENYLKVTTAKYYTPSGRCIQAINYAQRDEDGRALRIADSLTNEFKTEHGRIVRDGGGILPDVEIKDSVKFSSLVYKLYYENYFFDYAVHYAQTHRRIAPIAEFELTDEDYADFKKFLKSLDFSYTLKCTELIDELKKFIEIEGYTDATSNIIKNLEEKLTPTLDEDLDHFKDQIKKYIGLSIAQLYYYQEGFARQALKDDKYFSRAVEILNNEKTYNSLLSGERDKD